MLHYLLVYVPLAAQPPAAAELRTHEIEARNAEHAARLAVVFEDVTGARVLAVKPI